MSVLHLPQHRTTLFAAMAAGSLVVAGVVAAPAAQAHGSDDKPGKVTVVASNLDNPRGLAFGKHGDLLIAEAGHGGTLCLGAGPEGEQCAGLTGGLSKLSHGSVTRVLDHLISVASPDGTGAEGLVAVATRDRDVYAQFAANTSMIPPNAPPGDVIDAARAQLGRTIQLTGNGSWKVLASTGDKDYEWTKDHKQLQPDQFPDANPNGLAVTSKGIFVADAGANLLAKVGDNHSVSTVAYFDVPDGSPTDSVPTCVAKGPDNALYVGELLGGSYAPGQARVWRVSQGKATVKWTGFTGIQGCGFDSHGNFYATEFQAKGMFGPDPSGDVVQVAKNGKRTTLGAGVLNFPSGFAADDDAIYVSNWSIMPAQNNGGPTGQVVRIATD